MTKTGKTLEIQSSPTAIFMDVGCWQTPDADGRAMTTFGLVSGSYVLLCSWLKIHRKEQNGKLIWESDFLEAIMRMDNASIPPPIEKFLYGAGNKQQQRGFIHKWAKAPTPLTGPKELLIFVGDIHLHLYAGTYVDRFQYKEKEEGGLESLDKELRKLLDHAGDICKKYKFEVKTIQTGDMYEIWETEIILRERYSELLRIWKEFKEHKFFFNSKHLTDSLIIMGKLIDKGKVLIDFPFLDLNGKIIHDAEVEDILQNEEMNNVSVDIVENEGINFRSTDDICMWIRRKHPDLFRGEDKIFNVELRGNHDNFMENCYWPDISPDKFRNNPLDDKKFLSSKTEGASGKHLFGKLFGSKKRIWAEHGHAYDWHNNNEDWFLHKHGYEVVHANVYGLDSGLSGVNANLVSISGVITKLVSKTGQKKIEGGYSSLPSLWTDICEFEMRLPEIRRTDDIFREQKLDFYLVVMGHTHEHDLISGRRGALWQNDGIKIQYMRYMDLAKYSNVLAAIFEDEGNYYWTNEKSAYYKKKYGSKK